MDVKTNLTLEYINQYIQRNNIQLPKDLNLTSVFKECDRYDKDGNEVKDGDGVLQIDEVAEFLNKIGKFGSKIRSAMYDCYKEVIEKQEQERLEAKQEKLNNPPNAYDIEDGCFTQEGISYILEKLKSMGIESRKIDYDKIAEIISEFDFDIDPNVDSKITTKEAAEFYSPEYANEYMNKDNNGKSVDTHVLDWVINMYLSKTKPDIGI